MPDRDILSPMLGVAVTGATVINRVSSAVAFVATFTLQPEIAVPAGLIAAGSGLVSTVSVCSHKVDIECGLSGASTVLSGAGVGASGLLKYGLIDATTDLAFGSQFTFYSAGATITGDLYPLAGQQEGK